LYLSLGDSGYAHIAPYRLSHMSVPQQHEFNTPFQLSKIPPRLRRQMSLFGSMHYAESPSDSDIYSHPVAHGDVIVLATDGVWDNLSTQDVLDVVCANMVQYSAWTLGEGKGVNVGEGLFDIAQDSARGQTTSTKPSNIEHPALSSVLANAIVKEAKEASENRNRDSPFGRALKRAYPFEMWRGGKVDDICVVVGLVLEDGRS
jgi:protein phosphatase PTC7